MQWQHGKYSKTTKDHNVTLLLNPFEVDGRQLYSSPCEHKNGVYTRYHQVENITVRKELSETSCNV